MNSLRDRITLREHKVCPTCQYYETRLDAPYCSYCGGKHEAIIITALKYEMRLVPIAIDTSLPLGEVRLLPSSDETPL